MRPLLIWLQPKKDASLEIQLTPLGPVALPKDGPIKEHQNALMPTSQLLMFLHEITPKLIV